MQKVKIFKSIESELGALEKEINDWVEADKVRLISVTGNIAPQTPHGNTMGAFSASDVLVIVVYEDANG